MQNPFTTTFNKTPEYTYIITEATGEILDNFAYDQPSESVYKITGVRGSGKTVILAKIENQLRSEENKNRGWLVFDLSPARDMLGQIAAMLQKEGFRKRSSKATGINLSATVLGTGGGIGYTKTEQERYQDIGVDIEEMIRSARDAGKRILLGIDEVSRTREMVELASEYGRWLRAGYPVYMVCTGLYENIQEVSNVKNLTFFRRATTIQTKPLNMIRMSEMYQKQLDIEASLARRMAEITKGYAYAFQELGSLYFRKSDEETLDSLIPSLRTELFAYSYEKIWEELTDSDRFMAGLLVNQEEYKREDVLKLMGDKAGNYSMYRDRLLKRGILTASRRGYISYALPYFADFVREYCL